MIQSLLIILACTLDFEVRLEKFKYQKTYFEKKRKNLFILRTQNNV